MRKYSYLAIILAITTTAAACDLIYNPASRSTGGYCLCGLSALGLITFVLLISKPNAEG